MTRDQFIQENPLLSLLERDGIRVLGGGNQRMARCPFHKDGKPSMSVKVAEGLWNCQAGCGGGSVIDYEAMRTGVTPGEWCRQNLTVTETRQTRRPSALPQRARETPPPADKKIVATYDYHNEMGKLVYQAVRYEPKDFRQRRPVGEWAWKWDMEGVQRVIYRLPQVLSGNTRQIVVVEGEKDADNLVKMGFVATCNVGGAKKWINAYAEPFHGKEAIVCGDNDGPGEEHVKMVIESLEGKAKSIRRVKIPGPHKDVSDFIQAFPDMAAAKAAWISLVENAPIMMDGGELPIKSMADLEREYEGECQSAETRTLNLGEWLPSFRQRVRGIVPGEIVVIIGGTGVGKSYVLQNIMLRTTSLPTLFFELELPGSLTFERFAAMSTGESALEINALYTMKKKSAWREMGNINHVFTCTKSRLKVAQIEKIIDRAEAKMGVRPAMFMLDYIQLLDGDGKRYEVISEAAEDIKRVAKATGTIGVITSQAKRKEGELEIYLNDAKESGSIENSAGLVLGIWRPEAGTMMVKILKNTKGRGDKKGAAIKCDCNGDTGIITEASKIEK